MHRVLPLVLLACTAACDTRFDPDESAAGRVIESTAPQWSAGDAWTLDSIPELTIGQANGPAEYALSNVVGGTRLSDGRIAIANRGTNDVRYYDARGRHVRTVGREGNGPGEFRFIDATGNAGDTVLVWDAFARRVSRFDPAGTLVGPTTLASLDLPFPVLAGFLGDGSMLLRPRGDLDRTEGRQGEYVDSITFLRFSARTGALIDSLGPYLGGELFQAVVDRRSMTAHVLFGRRGLTAPAAGGFYRAETDRFAATLHAPDGTPVRTLRRPHAPARTTAADLAVARKEREARDEEILRMSPDMAAAQRRLMETLPHRSTRPAITEIRVDRQDNLWMRAYAPPDAASAEWSVFAPNGRWLGIVAVPADLLVLEIGDDWMLGTRADPRDGVERVVLHRLRKPR